MNNTIIVLLLLVTSSIATNTIKLKYDQLEIETVRLTPRGRDNEPLQLKSHHLILLTDIESGFNGQRTDQENNIVLLMPYKTYWDEDVCKYEELWNISCVIINSTTTVNLGSNINKGYNQCSYHCVLEIFGTDYQLLEQVYNNVTVKSNYSEWVEIDTEIGPDSNPWKLMAYSVPYMMDSIIGGLSCLVMIVWNSLTLFLIKTNGLSKYKVWIGMASLITLSSMIGLMTHLDFNCFFQLLPYRLCTILSGIRPAFVYSACTLFLFSMIQATKKHIRVDYKLTDHLTIYLIMCIGYLAFNLSCAIAITYIEDNNSLYGLLFIWLIVQIGYMVTIVVLFGIVSIKTLKKISQSIKMTQDTKKIGLRFKQFRRIAALLIVISACTIVYIAMIGFVNYAIFYPDLLSATFLIYNTMLNIISMAFTYNIYFCTVNNIQRSKTSSNKNSKSTNSNATAGTNNTNSLESVPNE